MTTDGRYCGVLYPSNISGIPDVCKTATPENSELTVRHITTSTNVCIQTWLQVGSNNQHFIRYGSKSAWSGWYDLINNSMVSIHNVNANSYTINVGLSYSGIAYKNGTMVIIKASFSGAYFDAAKFLFTVDSSIKPSKSYQLHIRCKRVSDTTNGQNDFISSSNCYIDAEGCIYQTFNSDGAASLWTGDIFGCYDLR